MDRICSKKDLHFAPGIKQQKSPLNDTYFAGLLLGGDIRVTFYPEGQKKTISKIIPSFLLHIPKQQKSMKIKNFQVAKMFEKIFVFP